METKTKTKEEWKDLIIKFIKENGIENLNTNTKYENLRYVIRRIKSRYKEALPEKKEEIQKFWDCFPDGFLDKQK